MSIVLRPNLRVVSSYMSMYQTEVTVRREFAQYFLDRNIEFERSCYYNLQANAVVRCRGSEGNPYNTTTPASRTPSTPMRLFLTSSLTSPSTPKIIKASFSFSPGVS